MAEHDTSDDWVALIANQGPRSRIAEILQREAISARPFDDRQALLERRVKSSPSLIILWLEDTISGVSSAITPLTRHFEAPSILACYGIERWGVRAALTAGAAGVVVWKDLDSALGPCVRAVRSGQTCVPREHSRQIEPPALSSREKQILGLVVMGYMNSQIAEQLYLAESTVKSHLSSAFGKLGVRSRNEAVKLILDPNRGLGMGILGIGAAPVESQPSAS
jgi:DNA-binding NarL/FixJ family response regulator